MLSARARSRIPATLALAAAACALGAACSSPTELHGSPILTQVYWIAGGQQLLAWSLEKDVTMVSPVPPFASEVDFVFDRRLDGSRIEDSVTVGGVATTRPKDPPAVRVTWPDMATMMSAPPFHAAVDYNSLPRYGGVSSYVYAHPDVPGFPSSETLTFDLVPELLAGPYGDPAALPTPPSIIVKTSALSVSIGSSASVVRSYQLPLTFSNRLPPAPATSPFVHVKTNGADVPYKLLADASVGSRWYLAAADCLGGWPASTTFTVTIDADFADAFGGELGQPVAATFSTGAAAIASADASCFVPEAGATDGGVDGVGDAFDGSSSEVGAADGGVDAAGDASPEPAADASSADADASVDQD